MSLATFHSNSKEVSYLSWQSTYPNLKTTCHIKLKFFLWTKLLENLLLTKYLISVAVTLRSKCYVLLCFNILCIETWKRTQKDGNFLFCVSCNSLTSGHVNIHGIACLLKKKIWIHMNRLLIIFIDLHSQVTFESFVLLHCHKIVESSHLWSLYLRMLERGLLLKTTTLLIFFLWLANSLKNL